jgi:hypothetical protein
MKIAARIVYVPSEIWTELQVRSVRDRCLLDSNANMLFVILDKFIRIVICLQWIWHVLFVKGRILVVLIEVTILYNNMVFLDKRQNELDIWRNKVSVAGHVPVSDPGDLPPRLERNLVLYSWFYWIYLHERRNYFCGQSFDTRNNRKNNFQATYCQTTWIWRLPYSVRRNGVVIASRSDQYKKLQLTRVNRRGHISNGDLLLKHDSTV